MFDEEVVVAGHICLDVIPTFAPEGHVGPVLPGTLVKVGPAQFAPGGAVANVGLALHRLGCAPRLVGKVGHDAFGATLLELLCAHDERLVDGMAVTPGETTSYSVVMTPPGIDRTFLHCPGANDTFGAADLAGIDWSGVRVLHFGYPPLMARMAANDGAELATLLANARAHGVTTVLDMAWPDPASAAGKINWAALLRRCLPYVDCFMPSLEELRFMIGAPEVSADKLAESLEALADQCLALGTALVAIKLGVDGLYMQTTPDEDRLNRAGAALAAMATPWQGRQLWAPCFTVPVAGTTGAGDATIAGFILSLLRGDDPEAAMTNSVAVGACSVEATDASSGIPPWEQVSTRMVAGWERLGLTTSLPGWHWATAPGIWRGPHDSERGNQ